MTPFATYDYEKFLIEKGFKYIVGVDEVGRGTLMGCVVACAVHIPKEKTNLFENKLRDSKKLSVKKREEYRDLIVEHCDVGVGMVNQDIIDEINILNATKMAMVGAIRKLKKPDYVLIDGNFILPSLEDEEVHQECIVKGDSSCLSIAAASIVAKVDRDMLMTTFDLDYPEYGFAKNKGYGTKEHLEAIKKYGPCPLHRRTFGGVKEFI